MHKPPSPPQKKKMKKWKNWRKGPLIKNKPRGFLSEFYGILSPLLSSRQIKFVPLRGSSPWSCLGFGGLRPSRFITDPPENWQAKKPSNILFSSWKTNRVKSASKSVKRLKTTAINKEATWKCLWYSRLSGLQPGGVWWRHRFQIASFSPSTLGKQRFQTLPFLNRSTLESVFLLIRFRWLFSAL